MQYQFYMLFGDLTQATKSKNKTAEKNRNNLLTKAIGTVIIILKLKTDYTLTSLRIYCQT